MIHKINIAFFGAPNFAADVFERIINELSDAVTVKFVVTQPDRPAGRKQILTPTPVKQCAQQHNIPVFENHHDVVDELRKVDLVLTYAYGEKIPKRMLEVPPQGFWNIHPSLLPLYRGPSPIVYPLLMGDKITGVSLIQMEEDMDTGAIIGQEEYVILPTDTQDILKKKLSEIGYRLFKKSIQLLDNGPLQKNKQNKLQATNTQLLTKKDGFIPLPIVQKIIKEESLNTDGIPPIIGDYCKKYHLPFLDHQKLSVYYSLFRGLSPWPGLWTLISVNGVEKRLKITGMELRRELPIITKVQLEGKNEVDFNTFRKSYSI